MIKYDIPEWTLKKEGFPALTGRIPCSMYSILLDNKQIPDPLFRDNEYEAKELSRTDCTFEASLDVSSEQLRAEHLVLRFRGIDTVAEIFVNGKSVGKAENMHRVWDFDVKSILTTGENDVRVHIFSPLVWCEKMQEEHYVYGNPESCNGIAHLRKSNCMTGWDWAPQLPDMGLFRPVELLAWDGARIEDVFIRQEHSGGKVKLYAKAELDGTLAENSRMLLAVSSPDRREVLTSEYHNGVSEVTVENPQLWWPNGLGEHPLYTVQTSLIQNGKICDVDEKKIGLRTLTVSRKPDEDGSGSEFCFVVNGVKYFAMGADYIPEDSILSRITPERTEELIKTCIDSNFNSLRVWGGGYYPEDWLFDLCDKYGLVVWEDFMFACSHVWMSDEFAANVRIEAIQNVKRIRNHACLGILCGNNEMESCMVECWDGKPQNPVCLEDYLKLYEGLLPEVCAEYAPDIFYWPSSASSGGKFDDPNDSKRGDTHFWDVWLRNAPFEEYRKYKFRYLSEFGFESLPNIKTINSFTLPEDRNIFSYVMESHQKCKRGDGNRMMLNYLAGEYKYPKNFEQLVYATQIMQADAIRYGVEHFRRFRGYCMGAVYWQLNDCWPVASWSSIDYYNRPKALQYAAKRFFEPTHLSAHENGTKVTLNVTNEKMTPFKGKVKAVIRKADFTVVSEKIYFVNVPAMDTRDVSTDDYASVIGRIKRDCYLEFALYDENGQYVSGGTQIFTKPKYFNFRNPDINVSIEGGNGEFAFTVKASNYAKYVEIDFTGFDVRFDNNYFDIPSAKETVLKGTCKDKSVTKEQLANSVTVKSVWSIASV